MNEMRVPEELLRFVASDLRPVRPLPPPERRALALVPVAVLLVVAAPSHWGWRQNLESLGPLLGWGIAVLQALVGVAVVAAGLCEAVPGRQLPRATLAVLFGGAGALVLIATLLTEALLPTVVPRGADWRYAWECFFMASGPGALAVLAVAALVARALPSRPAVAGALGGLGAGLMADAGARLFCWVSTAPHVLVAHGGAILVLMLLGATLSSLIERWR